MPRKRLTLDSRRYSVNLLALLLLLLLALIIAPLFEGRVFGRILFYGLLTAVLFAGGGLSYARRELFLVAIVMLALAVPASWLTVLGGSPVMFVISCLLNGAFCLFVAAILVRNVLRRYLATMQSVFGALAAYLLIGLAWAMFYWATEFIASERIVFAEQRFVGLGASDRQVTAFSQMVYFSFVTMSTLGYGDAAPATPLLQTLAWMQAVAGQFYIAVLVARLVAEVRIADDGPRPSPARDVAAGGGENGF